MQKKINWLANEESIESSKRHLSCNDDTTIHMDCDVGNYFGNSEYQFFRDNEFVQSFQQPKSGKVTNSEYKKEANMCEPDASSTNPMRVSSQKQQIERSAINSVKKEMGIDSHQHSDKTGSIEVSFLPIHKKIIHEKFTPNKNSKDIHAIDRIEDKQKYGYKDDKKQDTIGESHQKPVRSPLFDHQNDASLMCLGRDEVINQTDQAVKDLMDFFIDSDIFEQNDDFAILEDELFSSNIDIQLIHQIQKLVELVKIHSTNQYGNEIHRFTDKKERNTFYSKRILPNLTHDRFLITYINSGGFGSVFRIYDNLKNKSLAMKHIRARNGKILSLNVPEVIFLRKLKHENIITLHQAVQIGTDLILIMDYVKDTLDKYYRNIKKFDHFFKQLLVGVSFMHKKGIIHRDLKPDNILITADFVVKIADFGLSCITGFKDMQVGPILYASRPYRAPELFIAGRFYTNKVDVYSIGIIAFEFYTGYHFMFKTTEGAQIIELQKILLDRRELSYELELRIADDKIRHFINGCIHYHQECRFGIDQALFLMQSEYLQHRMNRSVKHQGIA